MPTKITEITGTTYGYHELDNAEELRYWIETEESLKLKEDAYVIDPRLFPAVVPEVNVRDIHCKGKKYRFRIIVEAEEVKE